MLYTQLKLSIDNSSAPVASTPTGTQSLKMSSLRISIWIILLPWEPTYTLKSI